MWTKKINLRTKDPFPTLYRKSIVVATWEEMITPIDTAIDAIVLKNKSLRDEIESVRAGGGASAEAMKILTVALNGATPFIFSAPNDYNFVWRETEKIDIFIFRIAKFCVNMPNLILIG